MSWADITGGSPSALAWVAGFLAGCEPSLGEFLGLSQEEADNADDSAVDSWIQVLGSFRQSGVMPAGIGKPPTGHPPSIGLRPWSLGQGRVWLWMSDAWGPAPDLALPAGTLLAGTPCAERGFHELRVEEGWLACGDCGYVAMTRTR